MFITFEGIEGSGKTTQIKRIARWLRQRRRRRRVTLTREPGGTPLADRLRRILLHARKGGGPSPSLELLLYQVARRDHLRRVIRPALAAGRTVLCDRFTDATIAYQGDGRRLSKGMIDWSNRLASGGVRPDLTILLDLPQAIGLQRSVTRLRRERSREGRFENELPSFHQRVRQGYLQLARAEKKRFVVVRAGRDPDRVFETIVRRLEKIR